MKYSEFLKYANLVRLDDIRDRLEERDLPEKILGWNVPVLGAMRLGDLLELSEISNEQEAVLVPFRTLLDGSITPDDIGGLDADTVLSFVFQVAKQVQRLNQLFTQEQPDLTSEERQAEPPSFGVMGIVDYAMQRFGLNSYDEALHLKAVEVWQAMHIDNEREAYQRRLRKIYERKK